MFFKKKKLAWAKHQKRWFGKWHLYLGIIAGFILSIVGITGSILVFQDEIDHALNPQFFTVLAQKQRIAIEDVVPIVQKKYPDMKFIYIMATDKTPTSTYRIFDNKADKDVFINPYTGQICGKRISGSNFISIVTSIHRTLLIPVVGRYIVGLSALCLLILTISGLRLWIPKKWKQLKASITVKFSGSFKRQNYDLHNVLGIYSTPVVALLALTGFCITFSTLIVPLLFILNGKSPQGVAQLFSVKSAYKKDIKPLPISEIARIGKAAFPKSSLEFITLPADSLGTYSLNYRTPDISKEGKRELVLVDQYNGKIYLNSAKDFPNVGQGYLSWLTPIHYGSFGGLPTRILAIIGGLIPLLLFITGFIIWWPRLKKQRNKVEKIETKKIKELIKLKNLKCFTANLRSGFRYALITLAVSFICGAIYGLISGIVLQPAAFAIIFLGTLIVLNFIIALITSLFNFIFLMPFKKGYQPILKYFTLSLTFVLVFVPLIILINLSGIKIF